MKKVVLGIDIGGTNTALGLVNNHGEVVARASIKTKDYKTPELFVHEIFGKANDLLHQADGEYTLRGIGVGAPNGNYYRSTIEHAPNLSWPGIIDLKGLFGQYWKLPLSVTNDANACALGEMLFGGAKSMKNFIVITLGTGAGAGIVVNGTLLYGHEGFAGEIGHTYSFPEGRKCNCGRSGCFESYVSADGIVRTFIEKVEKEKLQTSIPAGEFLQLTPKELFEAARDGDVAAVATFDFTCKVLARKIADVVALFSPEMVFLFGGIMKAEELILEPTRDYLSNYVHNLFKGKVGLQLSALDQDAGIIGAASLVMLDSEIIPGA